LHLGFSVHKALRMHGVERVVRHMFIVIVLLLHNVIDGITPLMAFHGALWHIGRKGLRYDNDGVFGILFSFGVCIGYEGEE